MNLTVKQTKALDILENNHTTELLFGGGAGGAKSTLGCYWQLKKRMKYPGTRGLIGRTHLTTLKETTLQTLWDVCKMQGLIANIHYKYSEKYSVIYFFNGSEILLKDLFQYPSDKEFDELGSLEITDAFIDEANQCVYKAIEITQSRIRYKLEENNLIPKILMTCNPSKNWTYQKFYKLSKDNKLPEYREFLQSLVTDNPYISPHYVENLKKLDKNSRERLLYGNWEYDDNPYSLIESYDAILDLWTNIANDGKKYITCDAARFGSNLAVIIVWSGFRAINYFTYEISKTTEISDKIKEYQKKYQIPNRQTIVDSDGVGGGVVDQLGCIGFVNNASPIKTKDNKNFDNIKSQCAFMLADYINESRIGIMFKVDSDLKDYINDELSQLIRQNKDDKMRLISKDDMKQNLNRSPDWLDTFIMRMFFELKPIRDEIKPITHKYELY